MTIGDVFARAWDLWRRDVGWLVLAGLVVGLIMAVVFAIAFGIFAAIFAGAGLTIGADMADNTTGSLSGLGAGMLVVGLIVYAVAMFLVQVLGMTFYGGMFEMVVGAYKGNRNVVFGDLFSGFRKFGSYALYALVLFGISIGLNLLNIIPVIGGIIGLVVMIWVSVIWIYVLPLIADQGLGFGEAASRSNQMVKGAGWWWTFGMVILLGLAALAAVIITLLVAWGIYQGSDVAGIMIGLLLFLVFAVLFPPYAICYVSVLYIASGGDAVVPAAPAGGLPGIPPAPPAPPAYGAPAQPTFGTPASATWGGAAPGATGVTMPVAPPPAGADAWKVAADPLAGQPPAPPLAPAQSAPPPAPPAGQAVSPADDASNAATGGAAAADDAQTAVTDAAAEAPKPPEPPAPPAPPAPAPPGGSV
jgi:hypothetical protein